MYVFHISLMDQHVHVYHAYLMQELYQSCKLGIIHKVTKKLKCVKKENKVIPV